jgi:hypothetical protein
MNTVSLCVHLIFLYHVTRSWMIFSGVIWSGIFFKPWKTQIIRSMPGCFVCDSHADISFQFSCFFDSQRLWQSVLRTSDIWKKILLTPNYVIPGPTKLEIQLSQIFGTMCILWDRWGARKMPNHSHGKGRGAWYRLVAMKQETWETRNTKWFVFIAWQCEKKVNGKWEIPGKPSDEYKQVYAF